MDRLSQVAWLIRTRRAGATFDEIVAAAKAGRITDKEAIVALEEEYAKQQRQVQEREVPCGAYLDEEAPSETLEDEALRREASNVLLQVLNALPPRQRQCVELYYFEGMTQDAVAARLGIPQSNVSAHLASAREHLATDCIFSPQDVRITLGNNFYENMMQAVWRNAKIAHPCLYPYELWSRYNAGTRQHANGQWTPIIQDHLREYINLCFGANCGISKPYKY